MMKYRAPLGTYYSKAVDNAIELAKEKNKKILFTFNYQEYIVSPDTRKLDLVALICASASAPPRRIYPTIFERFRNIFGGTK